MVTRDSAINTAQLFVKDCRLIGLNFYKVLLFGSFVKNQAHEWSDIDLLIVSDQFGDNVFENLNLYSKVNIRYPIIETHPYPTAYFLSGDDFISEISKESIEIE
jgi:uncharacterized protein